MGSVADIVEMLGGTAVLQREVSSDLELAEFVREGLPVSALAHVVRTMKGWAGTQEEVLELVGPSRTLERKLHDGARALKPGESDRLARMVRIVVRAEEAIGSPDKAHRWLRKPNRALGGQAPLALLDSDAGAVAVEHVLGRIEHGVFA